MAHIPPHASRPRRARWDNVRARLKKPISAVEHSHSERSIFGRARASASTEDDDDAYLGGELVDDPFARGPVEVVGRSRTISEPPPLIIPSVVPPKKNTLRIRRSFLDRKPLPRLPPEAYPDLPRLHTNVIHTTTQDHTLTRDAEAEECESAASSPLSEGSFHTCLSPESDPSCGESCHSRPTSWRQSTPEGYCHISGRWPEMRSLPRRRTMEALCELTDSEDEESPQKVLPGAWPMLCTPPQRRHTTEEKNQHIPPFFPEKSGPYNYSVEQFASYATEELSPLSMTAANVAFNRRSSTSLRRAASSPFLPQNVGEKTRYIAPRPSTTVESRPPSYSSGQERVPAYRL